MKALDWVQELIQIMLRHWALSLFATDLLRPRANYSLSGCENVRNVPADLQGNWLVVPVVTVCPTCCELPCLYRDSHFRLSARLNNWPHREITMKWQCCPSTYWKIFSGKRRNGFWMKILAYFCVTSAWQYSLFMHCSCWQRIYTFRYSFLSHKTSRTKPWFFNRPKIF